MPDFTNIQADNWWHKNSKKIIKISIDSPIYFGLPSAKWKNNLRARSHQKCHPMVHLQEDWSSIYAWEFNTTQGLTAQRIWYTPIASSAFWWARLSKEISENWHHSKSFSHYKTGALVSGYFIKISYPLYVGSGFCFGARCGVYFASLASLLRSQPRSWSRGE